MREREEGLVPCAMPPMHGPPLTPCMGCGKVLRPDMAHYRHKEGGDWCPECALNKLPVLSTMSVMVSALTGDITKVRVFGFEDPPNGAKT